MGSLIGHVLPGSFFILFGLWWTWSIFHKYFYACKHVLKEENLMKGRKINAKYKNSSSFPCIMCHKAPMEGIIKLVLLSMGLSMEFIAFFIDGDKGFYSKVQHMTMYSFFGLNAIMDILTAMDRVLIPYLDYATGALALGMEGILLLLHLDGTSSMESRLHLLLTLLVLGGALSIIWEVIFRRSVLAALSRSYFILLQGTWFYQIGFVLYVYEWQEATHTQMKIVSYVFGLHFAVVFIFMMALGYFIRWRIFNRYENQLPYDVLYHEHSFKTNLYKKRDINLEEFSSSEDI